MFYIIIVKGKVYSCISVFKPSSVIKSQIGDTIRVIPSLDWVICILTVKKEVVGNIDLCKIKDFRVESEAKNCFIIALYLFSTS